MSNKWIWFDWLVAAFRYAKVNKYVKQGNIIADIGCGREAAFLKSHVNKIKHGYGFDLRIQTNEEGNISLINNKDLNGKLPLENDSIDTVFLNAVLEHLESPVDVIAEAVSILKVNGKIIMTTPTRIAKPVLEFLSFKMHLINEDEILEHKHYFNKRDVLLLCKTINNIMHEDVISLEKYSIFEIGFNSLIILRKRQKKE